MESEPSSIASNYEPSPSEDELSQADEDELLRQAIQKELNDDEVDDMVVEEEEGQKEPEIAGTIYADYFRGLSLISTLLEGVLLKFHVAVGIHYISPRILVMISQPPLTIHKIPHPPYEPIPPPMC